MKIVASVEIDCTFFCLDTFEGFRLASSEAGEDETISEDDDRVAAACAKPASPSTLKRFLVPRGFGP